MTWRPATAWGLAGLQMLWTAAACSGASSPRTDAPLASGTPVRGTGVGIYVQSHDLHTVIGCSNSVVGDGAQLSNVSCRNG
jgi:hypothetical protein